MSHGRFVLTGVMLRPLFDVDLWKASMESFRKVWPQKYHVPLRLVRSINAKACRRPSGASHLLRPVQWLLEYTLILLLRFVGEAESRRSSVLHSLLLLLLLSALQKSSPTAYWNVDAPRQRTTGS